jgi:small subunit ribosomal protein S5
MLNTPTRAPRTNHHQNKEDSNLQKRVVNIRWVYSLNAGGRKQRMSVFVVVGNGNGKVGFGLGKAKDTSTAVKKAIANAKNAMHRIHVKKGKTVHHDMEVKYCASKIKIRSRKPGSGLKCGGPARPLLECAGIENGTIKSNGSNNPINLIKATFKALMSISSPHSIASRRGVSFARVVGKE